MNEEGPTDDSIAGRVINTAAKMDVDRAGNGNKQALNRRERRILQ